MNEVFNDGEMVIHDDREFITKEEAFDLLYSGKSIELCDPPDYGAEDPREVHNSRSFYVWWNDVLSLDTLQNINKKTDQELREEVYEYLRGYDIAR